MIETISIMPILSKCREDVLAHIFVSTPPPPQVYLLLIISSLSALACDYLGDVLKGYCLNSRTLMRLCVCLKLDRTDILLGQM